MILAAARTFALLTVKVLVVSVLAWSSCAKAAVRPWPISPGSSIGASPPAELAAGYQVAGMGQFRLDARPRSVVPAIGWRERPAARCQCGGANRPGGSGQRVG